MFNINPLLPEQELGIAEENFEINEIAKDSVKLTVDDAEVYQAGKQFDLVCANILGHLLIKFKNNIATWVKPGKYLVLAGILNEEFDNLSNEFTSIGFTEEYTYPQAYHPKTV
jgi:ribosomal protein L11 methyltransferase